MESRFINEVAEVARTGNGFLDYILINDASSILVVKCEDPKLSI